MGTPKGIIVSYKYNARIRVATVRWAMINQLKHLPIGFEEVSRILSFFCLILCIKISKRIKNSMVVCG